MRSGLLGSNYYSNGLILTISACAARHELPLASVQARFSQPNPESRTGKNGQDYAMKTMKVLVPTLAAAALLTAAATRAQTTYEEAHVLSSTPIYHVVETTRPERQCWEEEVLREARSSAPSQSATPGILGAVIGGAVGNAVGNRKRNQQVGTVVGAILGGSIARDIVRRNDRSQTVEYVDTVERCRTVHTSHQEEKLVGYDVRYSYNGFENTVRLPQDPGATIRVRVNVEPVF